MEFGSKLEDLNLTPDEVGRLTNAMKDETFRKLLQEYAEEISNPENRRKYEEEIKLLEQERGMDVQFVHPQPFRAIKTSDGKQKCFINICSNDLIETPECVPGIGQDGRRGLNWSLPYSLAPGRPHMDSNGNKSTIHDVVFHPDTLRLASKNARFMDLVEDTSFAAVQESLKVKLDRKNAKLMKTKYKGAPQATVIRRQMPGTPIKPKTDENDPLAFPYPYDTKTPPAPKSDKTCLADKQTQTTPKDVLKTCNSVDRPTEPKYAVKYRTVVDLQDYRCSRDSAPGPRPREIVITVDLPLLRSAADADLDVSDKQVVLKSTKPAYLLELDLAYPVDENKGQAKFNKQNKQLVVTLPVLPDKEASPFAGGPVYVTAADAQESPPNEAGGVVTPKEITTAEDGSQACRHTSDAELLGSHVKRTDLAPDPGCGTVAETTSNEEQVTYVQECTSLTSGLTITAPVTVNTEKKSACKVKTTNEEVGGLTHATDTSSADDTQERTLSKGPVEEKRHHAECTGEAALGVAEDVSEADSCPAASQRSPNVAGSQTIHHRQLNGSSSQGKAPGACQHTPGKSHTSRSGCNGIQTRAPSSSKKSVRFSDTVSVAEEGEKTDEDDVPSEQPAVGAKRPRQPAVPLREVNPDDGTEVIISDHTTSSALQFQNSVLYDLD